MIVRTLFTTSLVFGLAVGAVPATAQMPSNPPPPASQGQPPPPSQVCTPGTHWEPAGYVHDGKWRDARCARDNGRE